MLHVRAGCRTSARIRNGQVHHLDHDPSNGDVANLVYLCLDHHEEAGKVGKAARRLTPELIVRYRDRLIRKVEVERRHHRVISHSYQDALDALIVMDVRKLHWSTDKEWEGISMSLLEIASYPSEMGPNARRAIMSFLDRVAGKTRSGMPGGVASNISDRVLDLCPIHRVRTEAEPTDEEDELLQMAACIGADLAYDGALYAADLEIVEAGCEILWRLLSFSKRNSFDALERFVTESYVTALDGAARSSTEFARELVEFTKAYGSTGTTVRIELPEKIARKMLDDEEQRSAAPEGR